MRTAPYSRKKELGSRVHREKKQTKKEGREREKEKAKMREIGREVSGRSRC